MPESRDDLLASLFRDTRRNAAIGWAIVALSLLSFGESVVTLDYQWILLSATLLAVMVIPPVVRRDRRVMLPWELLLIAAMPVAARGAFTPTLELGTFASYLSLAALALLLVVELDMFTSMRVTHWFAIALVMVTTLSSAALWTIVRWNLDRTVGTNYLVDNETLMVEFAWVTGAGLAAGVLFDLYFRRRHTVLRRRLSADEEVDL